MRTLLHALLIQLSAWALLLLAVAVLAETASYAGMRWLAVLAASACAWRLAGALGQPPGWRWLHAGFLPLLVVALILQLPAWLYAAGFVLSFLLFGATFRSRVPLWLSGRRVHRAVVDVVAATGSRRVLDAGAGIGGLVAALSRQSRSLEVEGSEWALLPWCLGWLRLRLAGHRAAWTWGSFWRCDFARYDLVFAYLSPAPMTALWEKACREMPPAGCLLSYRFPIAGVEPERRIVLGAGEDVLWVYRIPPR